MYLHRVKKFKQIYIVNNSFGIMLAHNHLNEAEENEMMFYENKTIAKKVHKKRGNSKARKMEFVIDIP